jgi:hypothetical protein
MWLHTFTSYILRHRWQTLALTFAITFIPIFGIIGILIATLMTLVKGVVEGALFTLAATLPYVISFLITGDKGSVSLVLWAAMGVAVLSNVLTWVFAVMLKRQATWSVILQTAALLGVLIISVIHLAYPEIADWWGEQLHAYYNQASKITNAIKGSATSGNDQTEAINITKQYATGLMVAAVLFNAIIQLIFARFWQSLIFMPGMLRKELHHIRLSQLAGVLFMASLVLSYLGNNVVLDIMPVIYLLFMAAGLSVLHYLFSLMDNPKSAWVWLSIAYVALVISLPIGAMIVAMLALFDIWVDTRKRFKKA